MKEPTEKDFYLSVGCFGGELSAIPKPWKTLFPEAYKYRKRRVYITESTFKYVCPGASHYKASIQIEQNALWDGEKWRVPWKRDDNTCWDDTIVPPEFYSKTAGRAVELAEKWLLRNLDPNQLRLSKEYYELEDIVDGFQSA